MLSRRSAGASLILLTASILGGFSTPAQGAVARYASPTGSGTACTQEAPCSLATAITSSAADDDVYVVADQGDYTLSSGINSGNSVPVHVHGLNGRARLIFSTSGLRIGRGSVDNLYVEGHTSQTAFSLGPTAVGDRIFAKMTSTGHACYIEGSTLTNSVCWAGPAGDLALESDFSNSLRNDSFVGGTRAAILFFGRECSCPVTNTVVNVIARTSATNGVDLEVTSDGSVDHNVNLSYSNFDTTRTSGTASMVHVNSDSTNQSDPPLFVDATNGDFHEQSGSPTIDAGVNDAQNGSTDLDGNPRTVNGTTDIGAYESSSAPSPPDTEIVKSTIKKTKRKATFSFQAVGAADGFECALKKPKVANPVFAACTSPKTYKRLKDGRYTFSVRASSSSGVDPTPATKSFKI
jgi:hypothetical protein